MLRRWGGGGQEFEKLKLRRCNSIDDACGCGKVMGVAEA
jgi:hypothetical protein